MRLIKCIAVMLLFSLTVTGCRKTPAEDSYVGETDFQYQYYNNSSSHSTIARGKADIYFSVGKYIYQMDEETETVTPLCNKANCLHDKEKDENKLSECNAYIGNDINDENVSYMNGFLYSITLEEKGDEFSSSLYKIAEDGSAKDRVYQWDGAFVNSWCFHRNVLYYVELSYDENNMELYAIKEMKLTGMGKLKPKTIWETDKDKDITVVGCSSLIAYGNHLYFNVDGAKGNDVTGLASDEDWIKYYYNKTFQYNLENKTLSEIQIPNQTETQQIDVTFWQNRIVCRVFDVKKNYQFDAVADVYIADLDGTNAEVLLKDMPMYRSFSSDGTYLYVSNWSECTARIIHSSEFQENLKDNTGNKKWDYKVNVDIYDKDMKLVDSVEPPFHDDLPRNECTYGIGDRMYVQVENASGGGTTIQYWDKTKIGTYKGKEYQLTPVCDIGEVEVGEEE